MKSVTQLIRESELIKKSDMLSDTQKAIELSKIRAEIDKVVGQQGLELSPSTGQAKK